MSHKPTPWCSSPKCPCAVPGVVCGEWKGFNDITWDPDDSETDPARWCIQCGYEREDHTA